MTPQSHVKAGLRTKAHRMLKKISQPIVVAVCLRLCLVSLVYLYEMRYTRNATSASDSRYLRIVSSMLISFDNV